MWDKLFYLNHKVLKIKLSAKTKVKLFYFEIFLVIQLGNEILYNVKKVKQKDETNFFKQKLKKYLWQKFKLIKFFNWTRLIK